MLILCGQPFEIDRLVTEIRRIPGAGREEVCLGISRLAKQIDEFRAVSPLGGAVKHEVIHVQLETAISADADHLIDLIYIIWRSERRHAHHLVLAFIDLKTEEGGERAVEEAERMREPDFTQHLDVGAPANPDAGSRPFADAVDGEDRRVFEGRAEESTGGVRKVMLAEQDAVPGNPKACLQKALDPKLIAQTGDHRFAEYTPRAGEHLQAGQQEAFELQKRFFEKRHIVEILGADAYRSQTEIDGVLREVVIVFLSSETFFFGRRYQLAVPQDRRSRIVKITGNS